MSRRHFKAKKFSKLSMCSTYSATLAEMRCTQDSSVSIHLSFRLDSSWSPPPPLMLKLPQNQQPFNASSSKEKREVRIHSDHESSPKLITKACEEVKKEESVCKVNSYKTETRSIINSATIIKSTTPTHKNHATISFQNKRQLLFLMCQLKVIHNNIKNHHFKIFIIKRGQTLE
ncbi:hypothetical protein VNO77_19690 [Canavalia gladiata]|uniref:Uncharacterized protein n=1 Tax=Canavalia gladiata TaxID=3824 RepID=A0AAN9QKR0_CANGL